MISVKVQLFARLRELCDDRSEIEVRLPEGADAAACFAEICATHGAARDQRTGLVVAVNEEYAAWDAALHEGDRVAFIPPVSGG